MNGTNQRQLDYKGNLAIIKIVAATIIVFHHFQQVFSVQFGGIEFYGGSFNFGYLVELFFLVSGFLVEYRLRDDRTFMKYIIHKLKRYYPFAIIACIFSLIIALIYYTILGKPQFDLNYDFFTVIASIFLFHSGWIIEFSPAINNPTWYLCVLTICYMVFYFINKISNKKVKNTIPFIISVAMVPSYYVITHWSISIPFFHLMNIRGYASFFLGIGICFLYKNLQKRTIIFIDVILGVLSIGVAVFLKAFNWYIFTYMFYPMIVFLALIIPQLNNHSITKLGEISFEVYLWHVPIMAILNLIIDVTKIEISYSYLVMLCLCLFIWIWSTMIYYIVQNPLSKILKKIC